MEFTLAPEFTFSSQPYKPGISLTKQDFHLQRGILGLQRGFSGYYLPTHLNYILQIGKQSQEVAIVIDDVVIL